MDTIEVKNTGPVEYALIPCPEEGGIVILTGENGAGKSKVQEGLELFATRRGNITVRDGADRAEIVGLGMTLRRAVQKRHLGQLVVGSLIGKLSIEELVDPKIDDPVAADNARIKALIQLTGKAKAEPSLFYDLLGGEEKFNQIIPVEALKTDDLLTLSGNIKRALEKIARDKAAEAEKEHSKAEAERLTAASVDTSLPNDSGLLAIEFEEATREESRLKAEKKAREDAEKRTAHAREALERTKAGYKGPTLEEAKAIEGAAYSAMMLAKDEVKRLEFLLTDAKKVETAAVHAQAVADKVEESAKNHEISIKAFEETVNAELPPEVTEETLAAASARINTAKEAVETGALVRRAKESLAKAEAAQKDAAECAKLALAVRDAAQGTDIVLSRVVESLESPLFVRAGRLKLNTERGEELFEDLSKGQRCKIAARIAIKALKELGPRGLFNIPQELWEGLNPANKRDLLDELSGTGVVAVVAEATDEKGVHARIFDPYQLV